MIEEELHSLISNDISVQKAILLALEADDIQYDFVSEDQFPNGMYSDFTVKKDNKVLCIIELKGDNIGVNDYVRGIGQVFEYQHFIDDKMSRHNYEYSKDSCSVYCFPSSLLKNTNYNIGLFKYPEGTKLLELNEHNHSVRLISEDELKRIASASDDSNLVAISQYYIRDTRLYELYICLKYCAWKKTMGCASIDRNKAEINFLRKLETPDNRNWRNVFIALKSLGLIDSKNLPTPVGFAYAGRSYEDFCYSIYNSYIKTYIDLMMNILLDVRSEQNCMGEFLCDYHTISDRIDALYNGKKVLYVTDSENRYLSSWLNIMRDDYKCIDFEIRSSIRTIEYNIGETNEVGIKRHLANNVEAHRFIEKLEKLMQETSDE